MSYVDLHLHLLPGVDDGAPDLQHSLEYARRMVAEGVSEATVTPHVGAGLTYDPLTIPARVAALQESLDARAIELRLHAGGEIHPARARHLSDTVLEIVAHGPQDSRWVLFEVPFTGVDEHFVAGCRELRQRGYGVLVAHPERAAGLLPGGLDLLRPELEAGALLQVNVCSLLGNHGVDIQRAAHELVRDGLAFVLASDAHPGTREHTLRLGFDLALRAGASSLAAWRLTQGNPRFLLEQGIPPWPRWLGDPRSAPDALSGDAMSRHHVAAAGTAPPLGDGRRR
jgi:protein-tyrosine phosphatase